MTRAIQVIIVFMLVIIMIWTSCDTGTKRKSFVWDDEVAELTGRSLYTWLRKAPFDPEFDKYEHRKKGQVVLSNEKQVFPFMARYYNAEEELRTRGMLTTEQDTFIYQEKYVLYRDSIWGDLFVAATLLYDDQEVFLRNRYLAFGNPLFDGLGKTSTDYSASLYETAVFAKQPQYKTGIYWVSANFSRYLMGFYQQGQLVFESVVPLLGTDTLATLQKLKEVNHSLGLNIPEWDNAEVEHLRRVDKPVTFWKKPPR